MRERGLGESQQHKACSSLMGKVVQCMQIKKCHLLRCTVAAEEEFAGTTNNCFNEGFSVSWPFGNWFAI